MAKYGWMGGLGIYFYKRLLFGQEHAISRILGLATHSRGSIDFVCRDAKQLESRVVGFPPLGGHWTYQLPTLLMALALVVLCADIGVPNAWALAAVIFSLIKFRVGLVNVSFCRKTNSFQ